jgi:hypothetical protein
MLELLRATSPPSLSRAAFTSELPRAASTPTPPHTGAPEGHLAAIEVAQEEVVEVIGEGGLGGGGAAERVTADREAQGGAAEHDRRGRYEQQEPRWMGARANEIMMTGVYRGDKGALLFFKFFGP